MQGLELQDKVKQVFPFCHLNLGLFVMPLGVADEEQKPI